MIVDAHCHAGRGDRLNAPWSANAPLDAYDALPTREVCDAVRRLRIPMLVDVVGRAYIVDLLAPEYPDVNFIIPHLGSFMDDWRAQQQVVDQLVRLPSCVHLTSWTISSSLRRKPAFCGGLHPARSANADRSGANRMSAALMGALLVESSVIGLALL